VLVGLAGAASSAGVKGSGLEAARLSARGSVCTLLRSRDSLPEGSCKGRRGGGKAGVAAHAY